MLKKTFSIVLAASTLSGCISNNVIKSSRDNSMREWNKTIRSAQVIPIVPLVQEPGLTVGSVFITPLTTNEEVESWNEDGLLEINNTFSRIKIDPTQLLNYDVAIPTYSVNYNQRSGIGTRLNVHAIPLAAAYSSSNDGNISVTLNGVQGKGFDDWVIQQYIDQWSIDNQSVLKAWYNDQITGQTSNQTKIIVRIVSKIFTSKGMYVVVKNDQLNAVKGQLGSNETSSSDLPTVTQPNPPKDQEDPTTPAGANQSQDIAKNEETATELLKQIEEIQKTIKQKVDLINKANSTAVNPLEPTSSKDPQVIALENKLKQMYDLVTLSNQLDDLKKARMLNQYGGYFNMGADIFRINHLGKAVSINQKFQNPMVFGYWALEYILEADGTLHRINRNLLYSYSLKDRQKLIGKIAQNFPSIDNGHDAQKK